MQAQIALPQIGVFLGFEAFFYPAKNPPFGNGVNDVFGIGMDNDRIILVFDVLERHNNS